MQDDPLDISDFLCVFLIFLVAGGVRAGYLYLAVDNGKAKAPWQVQGEYPPIKVDRELLDAVGKIRNRDNPTRLDSLVENWTDKHEFKGFAPLSKGQETTASEAPAYSWLSSQMTRFGMDDDMVMRWVQAGLGTLTALLYFFFARRAFGSTTVGCIAGLLAALHPFWILNVAEMNDGVLASFALAVVLSMGTRGMQEGGVVSSLLFGLVLAGLAMVRVAFLPFTLAALLWYLLTCRHHRLGWLCALLAFLGYIIGINPWILRGYQAFKEPVPIASSAFLHLWMGNNEYSTGAELDEKTLRRSLQSVPRRKEDGKVETVNRLPELLAETNQAKRYNMLAKDVYESVMADPRAACNRRIEAAIVFLLGRDWTMADQKNSRHFARQATIDPAPPEWLTDKLVETLLVLTILALFTLAFLGWRWSMSWRSSARLATLAVIWIPVPYILSHAETLSGPRLPLDGVLLCLAAYALTGFDRFARKK